ncbi:MAG: MogA/MoaB family molybdenum cofactor biosynthesis protein [Anaerolineae bacterium]|nr:MAG: MogA/MoaB family molybdenum cofactor biosynthesis protein [Anaerolineae bacterium]
MRVNILTVSDRSARGEREDLSGPSLAEAVQKLGWIVGETATCPDVIEDIRGILTGWADSGAVDLILTTGGTGFAPRDVTPEATQGILDKLAPGLAEAIRAEGVHTTPHALLSRGVAGIRGRTIILNLPGNPKGVREALGVVAPVLPHAAAVLRGDESAEAGHRQPTG